MSRACVEWESQSGDEAVGEGEGFSIAPLSSSQPKTGGPTVTAATPALLQDTLASAHLRTFLSFTIQDHLTRGGGSTPLQGRTLSRDLQPCFLGLLASPLDPSQALGWTALGGHHEEP